MRELVLGGADAIADSFLTPGVAVDIVVWTDAVQYEVRRAAAEKPRSLTCTGDEYIAQLHEAFHAGAGGLRITGTIAPASIALVLDEAHADMHLRFDALTLTAVAVPAAHVHGVAQRWHSAFMTTASSLAAAQARIAALEALVAEKDVVLDAAIQAKVDGEARLVQQCLLLVNAKKDMIRQLQDQLAQVPEPSPSPKRRRKTPAPKRATKPKRAVVESSASDDDDGDSEASVDLPLHSDDGSDHDAPASAADMGSQAYTTALPQSTSQFYSADQLLKEEEEEGADIKAAAPTSLLGHSDDDADFLDML
ncbi:hypothetical protein SPRG_12294 [Saprolegnia parasitica CBS 223.65]|uniref:Uncharacterized protein n=1 Tax=Saprolegnia parasitica (strain CBS 223.65) TaxID=695850 RepID=A0A067BZF7_SAPPC|nr:hypothetical protein SPRG_12294 [Saprolegnia parasitica CBS 223.65]KDO22210.1 hypothetical protein SPRG_12294 [Saprolegnia parasitica CBS 223.65]|eukprot:XP_012207051.1 hypothetical protein SPRG_12294 [Saprolegnia parasitica CBS 223.65]